MLQSYIIIQMNDRKMKILGCALLLSMQYWEEEQREREETMRKWSRFGYNTIEMPYGASQSQIAFLTLSFILDYQPFKLHVWGLKRNSVSPGYEPPLKTHQNVEQCLLWGNFFDM